MLEAVSKIFGIIVSSITIIGAAVAALKSLRKWRSTRSTEPVPQPPATASRATTETSDGLLAALAQAASMSSRTRADEKLRDIAGRATRAGYFEIAAKAADRIANKGTQDRVRFEIVLSAAMADEGEIASRVAREIRSQTLKDESRAIIAEAHLKRR
jgi:hypothetical protein